MSTSFRAMAYDPTYVIPGAHIFCLASKDEEKNEYVARDQLLYMHYSEGLDTTRVSDLAISEVTREQGPIRGLVSFTLQRNLPVCQHHLSMRRARLLGYWLRLAWSSRPAGFISTLKKKYLRF